MLAPAAALWDAAWQQMKTTALTVWQDLLGGVQLTWAEYGQPIAQRAALALEYLQGIFTTLWQNVLQPILTNLMQILSTLWSSHLKPLWDDILLLVASVANCLLDLWNNLLDPVAKWIIATFGPAFAEVFNAIADVVGVAVGAIADAIDRAVVVLRGLADFLSAVFRGNWDAAWQAIGNTVNTVWDKKTNAIKTAVNGIIGFINRMNSAVVTGNNAVITAYKLLMRMTESVFDNVLFTNLKLTFFCTKAASRLMMRQRYGRIINISSVVGLHGNAGQANYAASKAGLIGLTKSVAKEYAARNITANAVAPGFIETDMTAAMPESARAAAAAAIPAGRIGRAEDVAAAVAFLAGEQAGYITGQVLCVDGGLGL